MRPGHFVRLLARESRGSRGRLAFFAACLSVGVAAVVAVAGLGQSLDAALTGQARELLAADVVVEGRRPAPESLDDALASLAEEGLGPLRRADLRELVTMASVPSVPDGPPGGPEGTPGPSRLVELKVVDGPYPFYGELVLEPARPLAELLAPRGPGGAPGVVVGPELLEALGLAVGDPLRLGGASFPVTGVVTGEPDRLGAAFGLAAGPRVFLSAEGFERAALTATGSRIEHRVLLALPEDSPADLDEGAVVEHLKDALPADGSFEVESWREAQPALRGGLDRLESFLGLVALLSLLVGGIGVSQTVRTWLAGRLDAIAVLLCLGLRPREVAGLYLGQTALLGLAGSAVGAVAGVGVQLALPSFLGDLVPAELVDPWQPWAILRGLGLGLGVALLFGGPPLAAALRVPPARVLRRDAEPLPLPRWAVAATAAVVIGGVWLLAFVQGGGLATGVEAGEALAVASWFTGGLLVAAALLAVAAAALARVAAGARRIGERVGPPGLRLTVRHGLGALARPGAATLSAIVALGLGVLVVLAMALVQGRLGAELSADLPTEAPTAFFVDIQPDQWPALRDLLEAEGAERLTSVPVVTARLDTVDGVPVEELARRADPRDDGEDDGVRPGPPGGDGGEGDGERERWALTREQRLTWLEELPEDNRLVAGSLWSRPGVDEVSVEEGYAEELGVGVGSEIVFDLQGVPVPLVVTSVREVEWSSFGINFFLVVEPGVLDDAPHQRIAAARLPAAREAAIQDRVAATLPNVTVLRIREILEKITAVLEQIALGVSLLGSFTVIAGIVILGGAVSATSARRGREVALWKTLGATRARVVTVHALEYALVGLAAALVGTAGGALLAWAVLTRVMELDWVTDPLPLLVALLGTPVLTVVAGLAASARALAVRPVATLRGR